MSRRPENPETALRETIADRRALIVVGSGISIGASWDPETRKPHPQASWAGLLESGLDWLLKHNHISEKKAGAFRTLLDPDEEPDAYSFITVAQEVTRRMG